VTQTGGVCFVKGNMIPGEVTGPIPVEEKVRVADAFRCSADASLAGGYMEWSKASFNRTVDHDEINIVLDGELHLTVEGQTTVVEQGDMVYLPQGIEVRYDTPERVKLACVNSVKK
jgi:ethanolamine utilization protein EutQ